MGDIIHAMVALQFIKQKFPDAQIDWVVESSFAGVLKNNPHIDNILEVNLKSIKKKKSEIFNQYKIVKSYSKNNYDIVIDAQGLLKSAIVSKLIGAKIIAGFDKNSIREGIASYFYDKKVSIAYDANTIERNATVICEPLGIKVTNQMIINKDAFLFSSSKRIRETTSFRVNDVSPSSSIITLSLIFLIITSKCLSWMLIPCDS